MEYKHVVFFFKEMYQVKVIFMDDDKEFFIFSLLKKTIFSTILQQNGKFDRVQRDICMKFLRNNLLRNHSFILFYFFFEKAKKLLFLFLPQNDNFILLLFFFFEETQNGKSNLFQRVNYM